MGGLPIWRQAWRAAGGQVGVTLGKGCLLHSLTYLLSVFQAGKFSIVPTVINVGSGVALMGAVSTPPQYMYPLSRERGLSDYLGGTCLKPQTAGRLVRSEWMWTKRAFWDSVPCRLSPSGSDCPKHPLLWVSCLT